MSEERYEIRGKLDQGGPGEVFRAYDRNLDREVAIKRVSPEGEIVDQEKVTEQLLKEAKALSAIQHPHIVTVYDCGVDEDGPFIVMEILAGQTLEEMLGQGTLSWEDFREVVMQTQDALIAAQDLELVHRDLKPGNIMVVQLASGKFQIKLVDFGFAKFGTTPSLQTIDHGNAVFGSIYFMAPEQFERRPIDQRTDLYAMGSIYYYALTGSYPFDGDNAPQVMAAHLQHKVTPLSELRPDLPDWACEWVMWQIKRDMDKRPADARASLQRFVALEKEGNVMKDPVESTGPQLLRTSTSSAPAQADISKGRVILNTGPAIPDTSKDEPSAGQVSLAKVKPALSSAQQKPASVPLAAGTGQITLNTGKAPSASKPPVSGATAGAAPSESSQVQNPALANIGLAQLQQKKSVFANKGVVIGLVTALIGLILVVAVVFVGSSKKQKQIEQINEIIKLAAEHEPVDVDEDMAKRLLGRFTGESKDWMNAAIPLQMATGDELGPIIANHLIGRKIASDRRGLLLDVIQVRCAKSEEEQDRVVNIFVGYAVKGGDESLAAEFITAVGDKIHPSRTDEILDILDQAQSRRLQDVVEKVVRRLIREGGSAAGLAPRFLEGFERSKDKDAPKAFVYLRLAALTGSDDALTAIKSYLSSDNEGRQRLALTALGGWPDDRVFDLVIEALRSADLSGKFRKEAFDSALELLKSNKKRSAEKNEELWTEVAKLAKSRAEKIQFMRSLTSNRGDWVMDILDYFESDSDDEVSFEAEKQKEKL